MQIDCQLECLTYALLVKSLFEELINKGYGNTSRYGMYWKFSLPTPYHVFGGGPYIMRVVDRTVSLALAPPTLVGKQVCQSFEIWIFLGWN
jgi:hypothetical protein